MSGASIHRTLRCMGGEASVRLTSGRRDEAELEELADGVVALLRRVEATLTLFDPASELCALNRDPRPAVPAGDLVAALVRAAHGAAARTRGLVDATVAGELRDRPPGAPAPPPLREALAAAPARAPARPRAGWASRMPTVDARGRVHRAPGVTLDPGGLAKGLAADLASAGLPGDVRHAISCGGDLAVGTARGEPWEVAVAGAHRGGVVHRLSVRHAVATSGVFARLWPRDGGGYAHHLLDPCTGEPAWTGLVAVTAVARSALDAEILAKAGLLGGPDAARRALRHGGGVLQHDDGRVEVVPAAPVARLRRPSAPRPVAA